MGVDIGADGAVLGHCRDEVLAEHYTVRWASAVALSAGCA